MSEDQRQEAETVSMDSSTDTIGQRVKIALTALEVHSGKPHTANWLAVQIGIFRAAVYKWIKNPSARIEGDNLNRAAQALQVDTEWLAIGRGRMRQTFGGMYLRAESFEEAVKQIRQKGQGVVLWFIRALAE